MNPILIAEFGSSPAPQWEIEAWCKAAQWAGATHVKVQMFRAEHFPEAEQESKRRLVFPRYLVYPLAMYAHHYGLKAGASAFDRQAIDLIANTLDFLKLACREMRNAELGANAMSRYGRLPIYRSIDDFAYISTLRELTTLYAIQKYPAPMVESIWGLVLMSHHSKRRQAAWGWSSHTRSGSECILAGRLGASIIERHFCLSADDLEAGHSSLPKDFKRIAERIKQG